MRILFFGLISLSGLIFCGLSLYNQAYSLPGIQLPAPFSPPLPIDGLWGGIGLSLMILAYSVRGRLSFFGFYWSCALAMIGFFLTYTFAFAPYSVIFTPDSLEYLAPILKGGKLPLERIAGYPLFLLDVHNSVGLHLLPPIQLFCELFAYFLAGYLLLRTFQIWRVLSLFVLAFPIVFPPFIGYSFAILTDSLFLAGLTLGGAALAAAVKSLDKRDFLWAGLGIALATAVKSIGIVLALPIILILRFIPWRAWWKLFIFSAVPAVGLYGVLCWSHYQQTGHFSAETSRGIVLLIHVSGFLEGDVAGPLGLSQSIKQAVEPILNQRPKNLFPIYSLDALNQYITTTVKEHGLVAQAIRPIVEAKISNPIERDKFYRELAFSTVMHHPFLYMGHVGAHFYCLWTVACMPIDMKTLSFPVELRNSPPIGSGFTSAGENDVKRIGETLAGNVSSLGQSVSVNLQKKIPVLSKDVPWASWWPMMKDISSYLLLFSAVVSFLLIFIYIFWRRLAHIYASSIVLALFINTYFLAHALFSYCGEPRYSWVATPLIFFLLLTFIKNFFRSRVPAAPVQVSRLVNPALKRVQRN